MRIKYLEIQNFRKLKSVRIELSDETTLFVGANNSGKTSAMGALGRFLIDRNRFTVNDFTLSNWAIINQIGDRWEALSSKSGSQPLNIAEWLNVLPSMDVWLTIGENEIHYVSHLIPTLEWKGGLLGIRLRLEPKDLEGLYKEYIATKTAAKETITEAQSKQKETAYSVALWPISMHDFLGKRLGTHFQLRAYALDSTAIKDPVAGFAVPQKLSPESNPIDSVSPLAKLIRIDEIDAQRGFSDCDQVIADDGGGDRNYTRTLSGQLRAYYDKHINPSELVEASDVKALEAICNAQGQFDERLKEGFKEAIKEVEDLGYPGVTDPKLIISTKITPIDGLNHSSALQYEVISQKEGAETPKMPLRLPENYNGLGYQNLISMVFRLMSFRDAWMQVGKAGKKAELESTEGVTIPPLHLVLVEEPEAHLHAQVQQVFIRKAYSILRNHTELKDKPSLTTQLIVSTHSSHIAHESEFGCLRYFRRLPAVKSGEVPVSRVINLSKVFGPGNETSRFVTRYLRSTHCDLFFADGVIMVEGPAERILIPHFIRRHFGKLHRSYISLLEIGGSHAHRLRPLIEHLGITTLIVADLDAKTTTTSESVPPARGKGQVTRNETIKSWVPEKEEIDELLDLSAEAKVKTYDAFHQVRIAYQCPIKVEIDSSVGQEETISNTFEDALVFENLPIFKDLDGSGLIRKVKTSIATDKTAESIGKAMFEMLKTGDKAEFALNLLELQDPEALTVPTYIHDGLQWLQLQLEKKQAELVPTEEAVRAAKGSKAQ